MNPLKIAAKWTIIALIVLPLMVQANDVTRYSDPINGEVIVLIKESSLGDFELQNQLNAQIPSAQLTYKPLHKTELSTRDDNYGPRFIKVYFDQSISPISISDSLSQLSFVEFAEPVFYGIGTWIPDDEYFDEQWGLEQIEAPRAYGYEKGNADVVIAIIDTGVDLDHEDLQEKLLPGYDAVDLDHVPEDDHSHGTRMAGIAAAVTDNGMGIAGTCPNCAILPVRAGYNNNGYASFPNDAVFLGIEYAINNPRNIEGIPENLNPADILSMSFTFSYASESMNTSIADAASAGVLMVAAAGNNGNDEQRYPAAYNEVIAVAATDENDARLSWSNYGDWVNVAAPGRLIKTTSIGNSYALSSGTSASTPFVAGLAGLMLARSKGTSFSAEDLMSTLIQTSDPVSNFPAIEGGRINAYNAIIHTPKKQSKKGYLPYEQYGEWEGSD
ncbi:S8 family serine peptidase [Candidatus Micrarchaeota archaeon]|nr:S8 family serine peptidase [Candidatus Micrarchaeota archaeon]